MQKKQVILTHENADFDAIASLLGASKVYPAASPVLPRRVNKNVLAYLSLYGNAFPFIPAERLPHGSYIEQVILVDTNKLTYIRGMGKSMEQVLVIDHHDQPEAIPEGWDYRGASLGAATTLLVEVIATRLIPVSPAEATLMLAGIYEDTGNLTYASTTTRDLRAAAWLIEQGADLQIVVELLDHPLTRAQREIYADLVTHADLNTIDGHPVIVSWAESPSETEEEISTLAHKLKDLYEPNALVILVGLEENVQLVARSTSDDIDVAQLAREYGGDGHKRAAAALVKHASAHAVFLQVVENIASIVKPRVKVRDLMSLGVRTVSGEADIAVLSQMMLHTGHEGFPVTGVEGEIEGLVTRNAVDRALQHGWQKQPVKRIMQSGTYSVSPDDAVESVRNLMLKSGWGQIPVVDAGDVVGVITRTDMIRLRESTHDHERQKIAHLITQAFPTSLVALLHVIGDFAAESSYVVYFVGGIVRDLLLGQQIADVDLVVEGDAIALGNELVAQLGGDMRTHQRFGTFKWILPEDIWSKALTLHSEKTASYHPGGFVLPKFIDLVTARTEFYEHPTALPLVSPSSIKQDLYRRDFTINTLAVRLDPQRWGELLDFYGGRTDLEAGVIRVLHSLSFIDDPTRMLRAARFETRLDFEIEPRTASLIHEAVPLLKTITGSRIRHEFELIFCESVPEAVLNRLQNMCILVILDPGMICDAWLISRFVHLREEFDYALWGLHSTQNRIELHWTILLYRITCQARENLAQWLALPKRTVQLMHDAKEVLDTLDATRPAENASAFALKLDVYDLGAVGAACILTNNPTHRQLLSTYAREWRDIAPALTGDDLKELGFAPGPVYREIIAALKAEIIDHQTLSREQEIAFIKTHFATYLTTEAP